MAKKNSKKVNKPKSNSKDKKKITLKKKEKAGAQIKNVKAKDSKLSNNIFKIFGDDGIKTKFELHLKELIHSGIPFIEKLAAHKDWKKEFTFSLALQAFIYGFPYIYLSNIRYKWTNIPPGENQSYPYTPLNKFWLAKRLATADYKDGGSPNDDTLYAIAILDLSKGPLVLEHPEIENRYFTFELADMTSDNFDYIGQRSTGSQAGKFLIYHQGWDGEVPAGIRKAAPCPTPYALIFGRTLIKNPDDFHSAYEISTQYNLTPLDYFIQNKEFIASSRDIWQPPDKDKDPLAPWKTMVRAMAENPPPEKDNVLLKWFSDIGIEPGADLDKLDSDVKLQLIKASIAGMALLKNAAMSGYGNTRSNSWNSPSKYLGRAGKNNEFLLRAAIQCLGGIVANDVVESVYLNTRKDSEGNEFNGEKKYVMHFEKDKLPKVKAFWSLTIYGMDFNLVANPINRYSLGDRSPGLKNNDDGSLTIYIQKDSPGADKESNWLPSPAAPFYLILRCYLPDEQIYEQKWFPPAVECIKS